MNYYFHVFKNYANFKGRARRSEYWSFVLLNFIATLVVSFVFRKLHHPGLSIFYTLGTLVPAFAVTIRRLHDTGRSGWWMWAPFYNLILLCTPGMPGPNGYGSDPKGDGIYSGIVNAVHKVPEKVAS